MIHKLPPPSSLIVLLLFALFAATLVAMVVLWFVPDPQVARVVGTFAVVPIVVGGLALRRL